MKLLDIVYPAALVMCDIAKSQDAEVGDGTTTGTWGTFVCLFLLLHNPYMVV